MRRFHGQVVDSWGSCRNGEAPPSGRIGTIPPVHPSSRPESHAKIHSRRVLSFAGGFSPLSLPRRATPRSQRGELDGDTCTSTRRRRGAGMFLEKSLEVWQSVLCNRFVEYSEASGAIVPDRAPSILPKVCFGIEAEFFPTCAPLQHTLDVIRCESDAPLKCRNLRLRRTTARSRLC